jgi:hypothetical protein
LAANKPGLQKQSEFEVRVSNCRHYAGDAAMSAAPAQPGLPGVTRGKKLVAVIGQRKALAIAVRNNKTEQRFSGPLARLIA